MSKLAFVKVLIVTGISVVIAWSCANIIPPDGGEKDAIGPLLDTTRPPQNTTFYFKDKVTFVFNEYLRPGSYRSEIFVSPLQTTPPEVIVSGKRLIVKLKDQILPNTTYVISVGSGIKDATEGNPMPFPFTYAFSTGSSLDSFSIRGNVIDNIANEGLEGYTILLYPKDSVQNHNILGKRPMYAASSTAIGQYVMPYLGGTEFYAYGILDENQNYSFDPLTEKLALTKNPLVLFSDSSQQALMDFVAFTPDNIAPTPRGAKWVNDRTILVNFNERIRFSLESDSLEIYISDTLDGPRQRLELFGHMEEADAGVMLYHNEPRLGHIEIYFKNLLDSIGNKIDTSIILAPTAKNRDYWDLLFLKPEFDIRSLSFSFNGTMPLRKFQGKGAIELRDSSGQNVPFVLKIEDYSAKLLINELPEKNLPVDIIINPITEWRDGNLVDTLIVLKGVIPGLDNFGSLSGEIVDSLWPGNWVMLFRDNFGEEFARVSTKSFEFNYLEEGYYSITLINDLDGNGFISPGSLVPYKLPEETYVWEEDVEIKANWDVEDLLITPQRPLYIPPSPAELLEKE